MNSGWEAYATRTNQPINSFSSFGVELRKLGCYEVALCPSARRRSTIGDCKSPAGLLSEYKSERASRKEHFFLRFLLPPGAQQQQYQQHEARGSQAPPRYFGYATPVGHVG